MLDTVIQKYYQVNSKNDCETIESIKKWLLKLIK